MCIKLNFLYYIYSLYVLHYDSVDNIESDRSASHRCLLSTGGARINKYEAPCCSFKHVTSQTVHYITQCEHNGQRDTVQEFSLLKETSRATILHPNGTKQLPCFRSDTVYWFIRNWRDDGTWTSGGTSGQISR